MTSANNKIHDAIADDLAVAVGAKCKKIHEQIVRGLAESLGLKFAEWTSSLIETTGSMGLNTKGYHYAWYSDGHCSLIRLHDGLIDVGTGSILHSI